MAQRSFDVLYKAVADFSALTRNIAAARAELAALKQAERDFNAESVAGSAKTVAAKKDEAKAQKELTVALGDGTKAVDTHAKTQAKGTAEYYTGAAAQEKLGAETKKTAAETAKAGAVTEKTAQQVRKAALNQEQAYLNVEKAATRSTAAVKKHGASSLVARQAALALSKAEQAAGRTLHSLGNEAGDVGTRFRKLADDLERVSRANPGGGGGGGISGFLQKVADYAGKAFDAISKLGSSAAAPMMMGALASAIGPLISLLGALGSGALGAANGLASLSSIGVALPGVLAAVGAGIGGVLTAMSGIGGVFKAFGQVKTAAGGAAAATQTAADKALALRSAQLALERSTLSLKQAQTNLNDARKAAIQNLKDLKALVDAQPMNEEQARADLLKAQEEYKQILADPTKSAGDRAEALAGLHQAEKNLKDVQKQGVDNLKEYNKAKKEGVTHTKAITDAELALKEAYLARDQAARNLEKAQKGANSATGGGGGAANALAAALAKLSPSARAVVEALLAMNGQWTAIKKNVQEAFFQPLVSQMGALKSLLPTVEDLLTRAAGAMGKLAAEGIRAMASGPWKSDFAVIARRNATLITSMGHGAGNLADGLRHVTIAAGPFTQKLVDGLVAGTKAFDNLAKSSRENGKLAAWLDQAYSRMQLLWSATKNVLSVFFNLAKASSEFTDWTLKGLDKITKGWADSAKAQTKAGSPFKKYLEEIKPLLQDAGKFVGDFAKALGKVAADPGNIKSARDILQSLSKDILPKLVDILNGLGKGGGAKSFLDVVGKALDAFDKFVQGGGGGAITSFFSVLGKTLEIINSLGLAAPLGAIAVALGTIAGLSFVSKITGITALSKAIFGLVSNKDKLSKFVDILNKVPGVDIGGSGGGGKGGSGGKPGAPTVSGAPTGDLGIGNQVLLNTEKEAAKDAAKAAEKRGLRGLLSRTTGRLTGRAALGTTAVLAGEELLTNPAVDRGIATAARSSGGFLRTIGTGAMSLLRGAGGLGARGLAGGARLLGGPIGIASILGSFTGDAISSGAKKGSTQERIGNNVSAIATGAGIGATIGSIVPGVGTAIGAGVGAGVGAIVANWDVISKFFKDALPKMKKFFGDFWESIKIQVNFAWKWITDNVSGAWKNITKTLSGWVDDVKGFFSDLYKSLKLQGKMAWAAIYATFVTVPSKILSSIAKWISGVKDKIVSGLNSAKNTAQSVWKTISSVFTSALNGISSKVSSIFSAVKSNFSKGMSALSSTASSVWNTIKSRFNSGLDAIKNAVRSAVSAIGSIWNGLSGKITPTVKYFVNTIVGSGVVGNINKVLGFLHLGSIPVPHFAKGGKVPGQGEGDTVPAMLTPGEFVIKKSVVDALGIDFFQRINAKRFAAGGLVGSVLGGIGSALLGPVKGALGGMVRSGGMQALMGGTGLYTIAEAGKALTGTPFALGGLVPRLSGNSLGGVSLGVLQSSGMDRSGAGFNVENLNVHNPVPERASDSLRQQIKKITMVGIPMSHVRR